MLESKPASEQPAHAPIPPRVIPRRPPAVGAVAMVALAAILVPLKVCAKTGSKVARHASVARVPVWAGARSAGRLLRSNDEQDRRNNQWVPPQIPLR